MVGINDDVRSRRCVVAVGSRRFVLVAVKDVVAAGVGIEDGFFLGLLLGIIFR